MKHSPLTLQYLFIFLSLASSCLVKGQSSANLSLKFEIERSIEKGLSWLVNEQNNTGGQWGEPEYPALTALVIRSALGSPSYSD